MASTPGEKPAEIPQPERVMGRISGKIQLHIDIFSIKYVVNKLS